MKVVNITFKQYFELEDKTDYNFYLKYGVFGYSDHFKTGDFSELPFGFVKTAQQIVNSKEGLTWDNYFELIQDLIVKSKQELAKEYLFQLHMNRLYIVKEIEKINKMESAALNYKPDSQEVAAGINDFSKFGSFLQFEKLAGGDILKIDEVKKLPYDICFTKLYLDSEKSQFEKRLMKLKQPKKK